MIVYQATKGKFLDDVLTNDIENIILSLFKKKKISTQQGEIKSWRNSLQYMNNILYDPQIPEDCGIAIEYKIPATNRRIDFIITGQNQDKNDYAILIELKQWSYSELTPTDGIVLTYLNKHLVKHTHPSYQVWSYAADLQNYNKTVYDQNITLKPCAYLHNYPDDGIINNPFYGKHIENAPLFLKTDALKLQEFIKRFVKFGDPTDIIYRIDNGEIRPSKNLADSLLSMIQGNLEFIMIDDQKIVYEEALLLAKQSTEKNKNVLIVEGGAGTGKSVVAINLLVEITNSGMVTQYVTKNAAPRAVYESKLTGSFTKTKISNLFTGSGAFIDCPKNTFNALIVDEAHRLNEKSGLFMNLGDNQIKEIIDAAKLSIFFIDEDQRVTLKDIGEKDEIIRLANNRNCTISQMKLLSQFRCNGSEGYLGWLDNILQIRETADDSFEELGYDFQVVSSPNELRDFIFEKNKINNKARLVAGYCWNWISKKHPDLFDIDIPEYGFKMRWNLASDGSLWILTPSAVNEIGCIHTSQGLEVDYIGVIIGADFIVRNEKVITNPAMRSRQDRSIFGYKKLLKQDYEKATARLDRIIKNTYKTLMTRGSKGCYIYCVDKETESYFRSKIT